MSTLQSFQLPPTVLPPLGRGQLQATPPGHPGTTAPVPTEYCAMTPNAETGTGQEFTES